MLPKWISVAFVVIIPLAAQAGINQDLFEASGKGETAKVEYLLQEGADVNALEGETEGGATALILAAAPMSMPLLNTVVRL